MASWKHGKGAEARIPRAARGGPGIWGRGTSSYRAYSRAHETTGEGKRQAIEGSSDPAFRGDASRYNPEELLVASLANCHMLWVLHYCADAGIVVTEYEDDAWGEMVEHADGSGEMTRVVLRPRVRIGDGVEGGGNGGDSRSGARGVRDGAERAVRGDARGGGGVVRAGRAVLYSSEHARARGGCHGARVSLRLESQ